MRLKNKKTGEIIDDGYVRETHDFQFYGQKHVLAVFKGNGHRPPERVSGAYESLAELNAEWEDYKEPKEYWYIDCYGEVQAMSGEPKSYIICRKQIGNYFETREEAEKAVEKLKAWKRLENKGFRFKGCRYWDIEDAKVIEYELGSPMIDKQVDKDLELLFGGEE